MIVTPDEARQLRERARSRPLSRHQQLHVAADRRGWTRRQFLQMGVALVGASGATLLSRTALAAPPGSGLPSQLPYTSPTLEALTGLQIPFFLPIEVDPFQDPPPDPPADPTSLYNFNGFLGLVEADGVGAADQNSDGVPRTWACDVRFMDGVFENRDGGKQRGTFAFFWLDVFEDPSLGPRETGQIQIHDFNPGDLNPPGEPNYFLDGGVFWTRDVPAESITVHPGQGDASFRLSDLPMFDYFTVGNALFRMADPLGASASVDIVWKGTGERAQVENGEQGFAGNYENATADVQWSASNSDGYHFSTAGSSGVHVPHAFTAHLRTGSFHP